MRDRLAGLETSVSAWAHEVLRGVGQVFFQQNAITGACFLIGLAASSPLMALGALTGAAIGSLTGRLARFDSGEIGAGLYGFNACLVGIASFFFFEPGVASVSMMLLGCVAATFLTRLMRRWVPFPTYTSPFVLVTWVLYFVGPTLGAARMAASSEAESAGALAGVANGVSQVMFQASPVTALLFIVGIGLSDWRHAAWVVGASAAGVLLANYHVTPAQRGLDPERLVERFLTENIGLGLYSYNATLAAVAVFLQRRSLIPPLLAIVLSVPLTEFVPQAGLPALTAPFVLATWAVLALGRLDQRFLGPGAPVPG